MVSFSLPSIATQSVTEWQRLFWICFFYSPSRSYSEGKSCLVFFFPEMIVDLTVTVHGAALIRHKDCTYCFLAATTNAARPSPTHFHWLSLYFHFTFSFLRRLFLLKCTPYGKTTKQDGIANHTAQLCRSACFGHRVYFSSPQPGEFWSALQVSWREDHSSF